MGGAFHDTPTLSVSGDIDGDGRVESLFAIADTLYSSAPTRRDERPQSNGAIAPMAASWARPFIADANGDGRAEIIVISTSGLCVRPAIGSGAALAEELLAAAATVDSTSPSPIDLAYPSMALIRSAPRFSHVLSTRAKSANTNLTILTRKPATTYCSSPSPMLVPRTGRLMITPWRVKQHGLGRWDDRAVSRWIRLLGSRRIADQLNL